MAPEEYTLKVWEIVVSALTPLAIAAAGYFINQAIKNREHERASLRRRQSLRKKIYDDIGPRLNQIFCFVADVGDFGQFEPPYIIQLKREVDRRFLTYKKLWSDETIKRYNEFIALAFGHYAGGVGTPAKIRTSATEKKKFFTETGKEWKNEWDNGFTGERNKEKVSSAYDQLVDAFIADMTSG